MTTSESQPIQLRQFEICVLIDKLANRNEDAVAFGCDTKFEMRTQTAAEYFKNGGELFRTSIKHLRCQSLPGRVTAFPIAVTFPEDIQTKMAIVVPLDNSSIRQFNLAFCQVFEAAHENAIESLALQPLGLDFLRLTRDIVVNAIVSALTSDHDFGSLKTLTIVVNDQDAVDFYSTFLRLVALSDYNQHPEYYAEAPAPFQVRPATFQVSNSSTAISPQPRAAPIEMSRRPFTVHFKVFTKTEFEAKRNELLEAYKKDNNKSFDAESEVLQDCAFCMEELFDEQTDYTVEGNHTVIQLNKCDHKFHRNCIVSFFTNNAICPNCKQEYKTTVPLPRFTPQPLNSTYTTDFFNRGRLEGYQHVPGYLRMNMNVPNGVQTCLQPRPGIPMIGFSRQCYLPSDEQGRALRRAVAEAYHRGLAYKIHDDLVSNRRNVAAFNNIPFKTRRNGGPAKNGYPDADYLAKLSARLAELGLDVNLEQ